MIKLKKFFVSTIFIICFLNAYSQYYYIPDNSSNLLLIQKKGDLKLSSSIPLGAPLNLQFAYSPIKHLSLSLSYNQHEIIVNGVDLKTQGKGLSGSIGTYVFSKNYKIIEADSIPKSKVGFMLDIYLGYTGADIRNDYLSNTFSSFNYNKYFLQTGFHLNARFFAISYALKVSSLDYKTGVITGSPTEEEILIINEEILRNESYFLLESDLQIQFGPKELRGYVGMRKVNTKVIEKSLLNGRNVVFTAGLTFGLNDLWKTWSKRRN